MTEARGHALMIAGGGRADVAASACAPRLIPSLMNKAGKRAADLTALSSLRERLAAPWTPRSARSE
jgi:hypothetical protein